MKALRLAPVALLVLFKVGDVAALVSVGDVMGFENAADWSTTTSGATIASSTTHTQGSLSLSVRPSPSNGWTPLFSVPISTLAGLSPTLAVDVMLPTQQANPYWFGAIQMYINCPSHNIYTAYLSQIELTGKPLGVWQTLTFPLPSSAVTSLLASGYSDLTFEITLNVAVPTSGAYLFDNLRIVPLASNGCAGQPNGTSCNDGNACTQIDTCQGGTCLGSNLLDCDDNNACTVDSCDPSAGCTHTASACTVQSGQIFANTFDAFSNVSTGPTVVTPTSAGAWLQFNNVDFGAAGTVGRFEVSLLGSPGNRHVELHLDSSSGPLVADLNSLPSDPVSPTPQGVEFSQPESGLHTVVIVFDTADAGSLAWFFLKPAQGHDQLVDFSPNFTNPIPVQTLDLTNLPRVDDEPGEDDVPTYHLVSPPAPVTLPAGRGMVIPFQINSKLIVAGQARWKGTIGSVVVSVLDVQGNLLAQGNAIPVPGGWRASVVTPHLPSQQLAVIFSNTGTQDIPNVQLYAGAVQ